MMSPGARLSLFLCGVFMAAGIATAFLPLWLADRGLSAAEIGTVLAAASIGRVLAAPVWGRLADARPRRHVLTAAAALAALASFAFLPAHGFWPALIVVVLQAAAASALMPLADVVAIALSRERRIDYGLVRASGSAAFMAATAVGGWLLGLFGMFLAPLLMAAGHGLAALLGPALPDADQTPLRPRAGLATGLGLLRNRAFLLTVLATACIQGSHAAYYSLASLHWRDAGISEAVIGLLWAEGVLAEILLFIWARRVATRLGPAALTGLAAAAGVLRWTVTGLTTDLAPLIAVQALHGATFGMQHLSAMLILSRAIPPERAASAQTLHAALGGTVSLGLLIWLVGTAYDGTGTVFLAMAMLSLLALPLVPALAQLAQRTGRIAPL